MLFQDRLQNDHVIHFFLSFLTVSSTISAISSFLLSIVSTTSSVVSSTVLFTSSLVSSTVLFTSSLISFTVSSTGFFLLQFLFSFINSFINFFFSFLHILLQSFNLFLCFVHIFSLLHLLQGCGAAPLHTSM